MTERIKVGVDLIKQLSETFYPSVNAVFNELVTNSSDALATEVHIEIDDDKITIEDNGEGMGREELVRFFYISSTEKKFQRFKRIKGVKRAIIGKFGIGKLSMYRICRKFEIISWKGNNESSSLFDFDEFEKKEFIEEFGLDVKSKKNGTRKKGTLLILTDLKTKVDPKYIKRSLSKSMPLRPDFNVFVNGTKLETVKKNGQDIPIEEEISGLGLVKGSLIITDYSLKDEAGIYIRVFGRVVNESNPRVLNFGILTHGLSYVNRIYGDINIDGLDEAILANRSGFIEDHPKYKLFKAWLKKKLSSIFREVYDEEKKAELESEKDIPREIAPEIKNILKNLDRGPKWSEIEKKSGTLKEKIRKRIKGKFNVRRTTGSREKGREKPKKSKSSFEQRLQELEESLSEITISGGIKLVIKIEPGAPKGPECSIDEGGKTLIINSSHPQYLKVREISREAVKYHCIKVVLMDIALTMAEKNLQEFKQLYDEMVIQTPEMKIIGQKGK